jgi:hypothetical protein
MRKPIHKLCTILATAACIFGLVLVAPAVMPTLTPIMTPVANADVLGNGYDVNCKKANDSQVVCTYAGCPRVHEDLAGDVVHTKVNGGPQVELPKACGNVTTETINATSGFNLAIQGCRKSTFGSDDCGAWSDYKYTPPAPPAPQTIQCGPNDETPTVPVGQQCKPKAPVQCPPGSESPTVPAGQQCKAAPLKNCPPGSVKEQVPGNENCAAPTNAVTMNISGGALTRTVTVTNNSALGGTCAYDAKGTGGVFAPGLNRQINVGPNGQASIDVPAPPLGSTYQVTLTCTGTWDGKQVEFGRVVQNVSSF